jgi:flagellar hook-basal body complex protein FliE
MSVGPISGISSVGSISSIGATSKPEATPGAGFADKVSGALTQASDAEKSADLMAQDVAAGGDTPIQELMIASTKATLSVEMLVQVRNRAVEAYQEIMRMQV